MTDLSEETSNKLDMSLDDLIVSENHQTATFFPTTTHISAKTEGNLQRKKRKNSGQTREGPASKVAATSRRPPVAPLSRVAFPPPPPSSALPPPPTTQIRPLPPRPLVKYPEGTRLAVVPPPLPPAAPSSTVGHVRTPSGSTRLGGAFTGPPPRYPPPLYAEEPSSGGSYAGSGPPRFIAPRLSGEPPRRPLPPRPSAYPGNPPPYTPLSGRPPRYPPPSTPPLYAGDRLYEDGLPAGTGLRGVPPRWNEEHLRAPLPPSLAATASPHGATTGGRPTLLVGGGSSGGGKKLDRGLASLQPPLRGLPPTLPDVPYGYGGPPPRAATALLVPPPSTAVVETNGFRRKGESTSGPESPHLTSLPPKTMVRNAYEEQRHSLPGPPRRPITSDEFERETPLYSAPRQSGWMATEPRPVLKRLFSATSEEEKKALSAVQREPARLPPRFHGGETPATSTSLSASGNETAGGYPYRVMSSVKNGSGGGAYASSPPLTATSMGKEGPASFHGRPSTDTRHLSPSTAAASIFAHKRGKYYSSETLGNARESGDPPSNVSTRQTGSGEAPGGEQKIFGYNVIVTNVPRNLTASEIQEAFCCLGEVIRTDIMLTSHGEHTGRVSVMYASREAAGESVCRFDGGDLNGNTIRVFME